MSNSYKIIPECHADTLLIEIIGFKKPNHQPGIGEVANIMDRKMATQKVVGVVDDDKRTPEYFKKFKEERIENNLSRRKHPDRNHYIIVVQPAFEDWVFNAADEVGIDPARYGFRSRKAFRNVSKSQNVDKNENVKQFLNAIKQKKDSPMNTIKKWITEILD